MVAIVVIMAGLLVWKGKSLLNLGSDTAPSADLNDYNPTAPPPTKPLPTKPH